MAKRSHRIASRQAAVGKERKRKKKAQAGERRTAPHEAQVPTSTMPDAAEELASEPAPEEVSAPAASQTSRAVSPEPSRYDYVRVDLRNIAIIAVPLLVLLIILAFIL